MKTPNEEGLELADLVWQTIGQYDDEGHKRIVFNRVLESLQDHPLYRPPKAPSPTATKPMDHNEAAAFGRQKMPWGKHKDTPIEKVPVEYLEFIADPKPFERDLRRYLAYLDSAGHIPDPPEPLYTEDDIPF